MPVCGIIRIEWQCGGYKVLKRSVSILECSVWRFEVNSVGADCHCRVLSVRIFKFGILNQTGIAIQFRLIVIAVYGVWMVINRVGGEIVFIIINGIRSEEEKIHLCIRIIGRTLIKRQAAQNSRFGNFSATVIL